MLFQEKSPKGFPDIKRVNVENLRGKFQKSGMGIAMQQLECRFYPR